MKKKHITHITQSLGGVETAVRNIVENIDDTQFLSSVITIQKLDIYSKSGEKIPCYKIPIKRGIRPVKDLQSYFNILHLVKELKPDIIHCHSSKGGYLGRMIGRRLQIPVAFTPHCFAFQSTSSFFAKLVYIILEYLVRPFTTKIIACSDSEKKITHKVLRFNENKVVVWKNCLPRKCFTFKKTKIYDFTYICSVGRPSYQKNLKMLIKVMSEIKKRGLSIKLVQLGVGHYSPLKEKIAKMIKDHNLEDDIVLEKWSSHQETLNILSHAELFVLSSRYEGLPYSIIEAFALGKTVVGTNVNGTKDIIDNNINGYLVQQDDWKDMTDKILKVLQDKNTRAAFEYEARQSYCNKYDTEKQIQYLEKIYNGL